MDPILEHMAANWPIYAAIAWALISALVRVTPTPYDDEFLAVFLERLSFLAPVDAGRLLSLPGLRNGKRVGRRPRPPEPPRT